MNEKEVIEKRMKTIEVMSLEMLKMVWKEVRKADTHLEGEDRKGRKLEILDRVSGIGEVVTRYIKTGDYEDFLTLRQYAAEFILRSWEWREEYKKLKVNRKGR